MKLSPDSESRSRGKTADRCMPRAMRLRFIPSLVLLLSAPVLRLCAQDLSPRAYVITPVRSNAVILTWSFYDGGLNLSGTVPITGATATYNVPVFSYYHSFNFFGR